MSKIVNWVDGRGVNRRSLMPDGSGANPAEGIPLDIYDILDDIYEDSPERVRVELYNSLFVRGIVELSDLTKPNAIKLYRQATMKAFAKDANSVIAEILEAYKDDKSST